MSDSAQRPARLGGLPPVILAAFVTQVVLLVIAAYRNRDLLNTDGIAYLRIASYYLEGRGDLMVSGYWGPMLSWLIAPLLTVCEPLIAARIAMALSALVFTLGCLAVFRRFQLPLSAQIAGLWIAVPMSVFWSVRYITPDLLLSGFIALAMAWMVDERWLKQTGFAMVAGVFWALAYFAKAIAFPLVLLVGVGVAACYWFIQRPTREILRALGVTWLTFACTCAPWMTALSIKYGGFTFSTSGKINHAIAGPQNMESTRALAIHPFSQKFHRPAPGRVTKWEDPDPGEYVYWSPLANAENARHQAGIVANNLPIIAGLLGGVNLLHLLRAGSDLSPADITIIMGGMDLAYLGLAGLLLCIPWLRGRRHALARERWRWAMIPVGCLVVLYLPVFLLPGEQRYFYPAWPFVWVAAMGAAGWIAQRAKNREKMEWLAGRLVAGSFGLPAVVWLMVALAGIPTIGSIVARDLASRLDRAGVAGPIAGSGLLPGGRAGLFVAYFTKQPWYGDEPQASAESFRASGAKLIIVRRTESVAAELSNTRGIRDLDSKLFSSPSDAENYPLKVFGVE